MSAIQKFNELHYANDLFVLPNAWDAKSARIFQEKKFRAVGTSSAAVANSLGYEDGEQMSFDEYLFVIKRILASVKIPVTVDVEMGYGKTREDIYANLRTLIGLGVAGINMEDSTIQNGHRSLLDARTFAADIAWFKAKLKEEKVDLFINLRCDTYILDVDNKHLETSRRLTLYNSSGADGIFLPCIKNEEDIAEALSHTTLPLNVMVIPGLPNINTLNKLGVKRVSMGPFMFQKTYQSIGEHVRTILADESFAAIVS